MGFVAVFATSFVLWIVLWALGVKAFDGIWIVMAILITTVVVRLLARFLPDRTLG